VDLSPELTRRTVSYLAGSLAVVATGASVIGPVWGLAAGAVWLVAGLIRRPWATGAVGWALLALTGAYVVAHQVRFGTLAGFGWPLEMGSVHRPALLGALLLAASAIRRAGSPDWTAH
jgi:biotin transporter BioY